MDFADWLPGQRRFIRTVDAGKYLTYVLSCPRGYGKTALAAYFVVRTLSPGDPLYSAGGEIPLFAGSIEQCRLVYRAAVKILESQERISEFRLVDSATRIAITRKECRTRIKAIGSNPKTSLGLGVDNPLAIIDEPGALHEHAGSDLWDSISTAQGKANTIPFRAILIGTLAPSKPGSWYRQIVENGTTGSIYVQLSQGRKSLWDTSSSWQEVLRVNPLAKHFPKFKAKLREEFEEAKNDSRLKARFFSYRLNLPTADESELLLLLDDWEATLKRKVLEREGRPVIGVDLGSGRAWSAAVAMWKNGRTEAIALAPGIPSIEDQEKRDRVPKGTYRILVESGYLEVQEDKRIQEVSLFCEMIENKWPDAEVIICDRHRIDDLKDNTSIKVSERVTRWFEAASDIRSLRKWAKDGPLNVDVGSRRLITASLMVATVKNDDQGNTRLSKRPENIARDDVAQALVLAVGRQSSRPKKTGISVYAGGNFIDTA